ncbi:tumor necrosis factor-like [Hoplias malabaricus]|uniref:tumor necrosis factor-like n=1 Tax=Hoplias malabaricus TaxID=27720 RepID=UPI003462F941
MGDIYKLTVMSDKPSRNWIWKIVGAVFMVALCCAASLFFAWHFTKQSHRELTAPQQSTSTPAPHQQMLKHIKSKAKAAIHLHVSGSNVRNQPLQWVNGVDQSFSTGGLKLENSEIVIPSDGLYFVYSQASFEVPCQSDEEETDSNMPLSYRIRWSSQAAPSKDNERYLLSGVKSTCQPSSEHKQESEEPTYEVIYLGAVFSLYKGDRLSTEANHLSHLRTQSSKTFFGVFEL